MLPLQQNANITDSRYVCNAVILQRATTCDLVLDSFQH